MKHVWPIVAALSVAACSSSVDTSTSVSEGPSAASAATYRHRQNLIDIPCWQYLHPSSLYGVPDNSVALTKEALVVIASDRLSNAGKKTDFKHLDQSIGDEVARLADKALQAECGKTPYANLIDAAGRIADTYLPEEPPG